MEELVRALGSLAPEHQNVKEKPRKNEELMADSPSDLSKTEEQGRGLAAHGG